MTRFYHKILADCPRSNYHISWQLDRARVKLTIVDKNKFSNFLRVRITPNSAGLFTIRVVTHNSLITFPGIEYFYFLSYKSIKKQQIN